MNKLNCIDSLRLGFPYFIYLFCLAGCSNVDREYYHDGTLMLECEKQSLFSSTTVCKNYERDGSIKLIEHYKNGVLNGELILYYPSGKLKYKVVYKDGGLWNVIGYYDKEGTPLAFGTINNGTGRVNIYDDFGNLREEGAVINGHKEGYWKLYSNKGLFDSVLYQQGIREGLNREENAF